LKLKPDNWGYVNFTEAFFDFSVFRVLTHPRKVEDPESHDRTILRHCAGILNYLLDLYSLSTENYAVGRVSPKNFVSYVAWHTLPPEETHFNHTTVYFPSSALSFEAPEIEGDLEQMQRAVDFGKLKKEYVLAYRLYAEARRAFEAEDTQFAAIQGIASLEAALSYYVRTQVEERKDKFEMKRISVQYYKDSEKDLTLALLLKILFPLVAPNDVPFPKAEVDACNLLRKARNDAIHDPANFDSKSVESGLHAVESLLAFLIQQSEVS
jgi:hypothetical protein